MVHGKKCVIQKLFFSLSFLTRNQLVVNQMCLKVENPLAKTQEGLHFKHFGSEYSQHH